MLEWGRTLAVGGWFVHHGISCTWPASNPSPKPRCPPAAADVLPVLMRSVCMAQQRHMVWRILRAMPLRLLERVMPWVAGELALCSVWEFG